MITLSGFHCTNKKTMIILAIWTNLAGVFKKKLFCWMCVKKTLLISFLSFFLIVEEWWRGKEGLFDVHSMKWMCNLGKNKIHELILIGWDHQVRKAQVKIATMCWIHHDIMYYFYHLMFSQVLYICVISVKRKIAKKLPYLPYLQ